MKREYLIDSTAQAAGDKGRSGEGSGTGDGGSIVGDGWGDGQDFGDGDGAGLGDGDHYGNGTMGGSGNGNGCHDRGYGLGWFEVAFNTLEECAVLLVMQGLSK